LKNIHPHKIAIPQSLSNSDAAFPNSKLVCLAIKIEFSQRLGQNSLDFFHPQELKFAN
jgi:hypothetical protein